MGSLSTRFRNPLHCLNLAYKLNQKGEMLCQDSGIRGCWFRCTVLWLSEKRLKVQYDDVMDEDGCGNLEVQFNADGVGSSYSCQRRELMFMLAVPFIQSSQQQAQASEASDLSVIQSGVRKVLSKSKAAGILRLAFHDAGTFNLSDSSGGMNGSIVYELDRPENAGLSKAIKILDKAKREIDDIQHVSWADLISVAGAEAVSLCGGPSIPIKLGRLDAREPDPQGRLPEETLDASDLKRCFLRKGFSTQELVALSGAHTLGSKGFGNPNVFDNSYFKILIEKPWASSDGMSSMIGLPSDRALVEDDECSRWISIYAHDEARFFNDFKNAYAKLVNSGASWRNI